MPAPSLKSDFSLFGSIAYSAISRESKALPPRRPLTGISGQNPGIKGQTSKRAYLFSPSGLP